MVFNSYIFILLFLPVTLIGYYGLMRFKKGDAARLFLTAVSLVFYAYFRPVYLPVLIGSICVNYFFASFIDKREKNKKAFLITGIVFNILLLFVFKYLDFTIGTINAVSGSSISAPGIMMPLGISFFMFQQIAYLVDVFRGDIQNCSFGRYTLFVSFFPKLASGPIAASSDLIPQFSDDGRKAFDRAYFSKGICRFSVGLAKKVLLADTLSKAVDHGFGHISNLTSAEGWVTAILYSLQLYFDFSGYCDMAVGIANCLHIDLPENFSLPYFADSVSDFWKRWHITLTGFLTKYVYIPLGGNRKGKARTLLNIMIVYLISGIWHGADWSFVLWGVLHGLACCLHRTWAGLWEKIPRFIRVFVTFIYVTIAWVFFRAGSIREALSFIGVMFGGKAGLFSHEFLASFDVLELTYTESHIGFLGRISDAFPALNMTVIIAVSVTALIIEKILAGRKFRPSLLNAVICVLLLVWCVLSFSGVSVFLYFNF